ncbi:hypothetical protein BDW42DRAFT_159388 [Aspergillus taichungensis]|uniref:Uncharacterized protein n=1 Tax=Aspergillus taichungensis TaxID=482145 RepID=A0A2J5I888_9EURO|nr:hypothetical protein BDW42DRAFT_159388 [Aspergillus taichungensis]
MMQTTSVSTGYNSAIKPVNQANQGWQRLNAKPRKGGHWRVSVKLARIHDHYSTDRLPDSDRLWQPWPILVAEQRSPREGVGHSCTACHCFSSNQYPVFTVYEKMATSAFGVVPTSISMTLHVVIRARYLDRSHDATCRRTMLHSRYYLYSHG